MNGLKAKLLQFLVALGGPGLAIGSFIDSSFVPLPGFTDAALMVLAGSDPHRWWYYTAMNTAGSVLGSQTLYYLARKGGEAYFERHKQTRHGKRALAMFQRYGLLAVIVPAILPPPTPFKIFVVLAGATGIRPGTFFVAALIGRTFRFTAEALLAVKYGPGATDFIQHNIAKVSLWTAAAILVVGLAVILRRRRDRRGEA